VGAPLRFGVVVPNGGATTAAVADQLRRIEELGLDHAWMPGIPNGPDILTLLAVAGQATSRLEIGSAVVPAYLRHPAALAMQALTVDEALGGRFTLGVGLSHRKAVERLGLSYDQPVGYMRDYLAILRPLLVSGSVDHTGPRLRTRLWLDLVRPRPHGADGTGGVAAPAVMLAALGPRMLRLAGEVADGAMTWMAGLPTIEQHIVPTLTAAARDAGRPPPRVLVSLPTMLTGGGEVDAGRALAAAEFDVYGRLPAYQAALARAGATGPADIALVGDERALGQAIGRLRDAGVTDFQATPFGDAATIDRTIEFVASRPGG
jgi:5,10-methylenetetrahydromethanopterin reductase